MIKIIPAIDIIEGRCVRLTKGDYQQKKVYDASPLDMVLRYEDCGVERIHMVDLDGARTSSTINLKVLDEIRRYTSIEIEWGGGISNDVALQSCFNAGVSQAIIGSIAALEPQLFEKWLLQYGGNQIILGADINNNKIAVKGWVEDTPLTIDALLERFIPHGLTQCICTDISKDGMLQGPGTSLYTYLQSNYPSVIFTVSGGIHSMRDIEELNELGLQRVIIGKAIYENLISLEDIKQWSQKG